MKNDGRRAAWPSVTVAASGMTAVLPFRLPAKESFGGVELRVVLASGTNLRCRGSGFVFVIVDLIVNHGQLPTIESGM